MHEKQKITSIMHRRKTIMARQLRFRGCRDGDSSPWDLSPDLVEL